MFPSCPTLFPLHARPDRASQIAGQEIAGQAGNDDMVPCTSFSSVMPDPDRASHFSPRHARPRSGTEHLYAKVSLRRNAYCDMIIGLVWHVIA